MRYVITRFENDAIVVVVVQNRDCDQWNQYIGHFHKNFALRVTEMYVGNLTRDVWTERVTQP